MRILRINEVTQVEGFTSTGIVILPPRVSYLNLFQADRERFNDALHLLPRVFESNYGIKLFYFNTNVIYGLPMPESMQSIFCLCRGDINYLNSIVKDDQFYELICDDSDQFIQDGYEDLRSKVQKQHPIKSSISVNQRVKVIETRECTLARFIAHKFALVISFESYENQRYGIKTNKMDGRILIEIELPKLIAKGYHSGEAINIVSLMNRSWAYKRVNQWEAGDK
jgi:hypothetical protein